MVTAYAGAQWAGLVLFIDLFGSYLVLSILGIAIPTACDTTAFRWSTVARRIVTFPPLVTIVIMLATNHLDRAAWIDDLLDSLAATLTPLALAAVRHAIRFDRIVGRFAPLAVGLGFRLTAAPLAISRLSMALGMTSDPVTRVAIFEMAMPPMLGASIIAIVIDHDHEPDLVALMISIGIPLSIITAPSGGADGRGLILP